MSDGAARLRAAFPADRAALMPYLMGGYPDRDSSLAHARAVAQHADVLELGIPFSDPLADGPTVQAAGQHALDAGIRPGDVIEIAEALRDGPPIAVMTYINTLMAPGPRVFLERLARAGVAGLIVPDLPVDEADEVWQAADRAGVAMVPFVAPTTPESRLAAIGRRASGFTYLVSVTGVTGGELSIGDELRASVARARAAVGSPVAVGFGIRGPEQAAAVGAFADGVVIGSQLLRLIDEADDAGRAGEDLGVFLAGVRAALGRGGTHAGVSSDGGDRRSLR